MIRTFDFKLYPNKAQATCLERWLGVCCRIYNQALEQRTKAYRRRKESVTFNKQSAWLTGWRERDEAIRAVPVGFERDALRRVERGMKAFFRRVKAGEKAGFPRFRSRHRYQSIECLAAGRYLRGNRIQVPCLGSIRCRGRELPEGGQKALRIIRKASGWYAQIVVDEGRSAPDLKPVGASVGIDVGLASFATLSTGEAIENPRFLRKSGRRLRGCQRRVSRRKKGSRNRRRAIKSLQRTHERIADQRKHFCHQHSTALVRRFGLIALEKLNVAGMSRGRFSKSILDAAWSTFASQLVAKAESAGRQVAFVDARGTSQECPDCGAVKKKELRERTHACSCGLVIDRDHAAARVILSRALGVAGANRAWTDAAAVGPRKRLVKQPG